MLTRVGFSILTHDHAMRYWNNPHGGRKANVDKYLLTLLNIIGMTDFFLGLLRNNPNLSVH